MAVFFFFFLTSTGSSSSYIQISSHISDLKHNPSLSFQKVLNNITSVNNTYHRPPRLPSHKAVSPHIFGQMFNHPAALFTEEMLRPEMQDFQIFVDGLDNLISAQKRVAQLYFSDGSIELACRPCVRCSMSCGTTNLGKRLDHPDIRSLFTRESVFTPAIGMLSASKPGKGPISGYGIAMFAV